MSAVEVEYDDETQSPHRSSCEIGSLEMPPSEWLFSGAASFQQSYGQVHPYLAAVLCVVGTLMNAVTVLVLSRPSMRSPVNVLLSAVAVCDIVVMSSYLIFVVHFLLTAASRCEPSDFSYAWALFMIFHAHASVIFHAASIWMTVSLAQIRVLTIRRATAGPSTPLITERFTVLLAVLMLCAMTLVNLPNFLTFEIMEVSSNSMLPCLQLSDPADMDDHSLSTAKAVGTFNSSAVTHFNDISNAQLLNFTTLNVSNHYEQFTITTATPRMRRHGTDRHTQPNSEAFGAKDHFAYTVRAHDSDCMKLKLAFWSNGMIFKVIPCLLLTLSIWALLRIIADVAHKRRNLAQVMRKKVPKDHTTPMLAAVLLIFLLAELPQGVFLVLNGIFSAESFHKRVYLPLGDLMDLLSLINSAVGFFIYVGMSRKFRTVFLQLLFSAFGCLARAELFLAPVLRPMLKLVWPCHQCKSGKRRGTVGENGREDGGVRGIHQSLRRLRERLELGEEFSETLQLLEDTAQRRFSASVSGENGQKRRGRKASERLPSEGRLSAEHSRNSKRKALAKTRSRSTEQYNQYRTASGRAFVRRGRELGGGWHAVAKIIDGTDVDDDDGGGEENGADPTHPFHGASCLLSGAEQYQQHQRQHELLGQQNGGAADSFGRRRKQFGGGGRRRWMNWRRKMSGWTSTEATTKTEQLSLCPSSVVGIPPLTLALSCSAGITAAAASVGVHLLQLEQPPTAPAPSCSSSSPFAHSRRCSSHLSSVLLTLPTAAHAVRRRTSDLTSGNNFLQVPKRPSAMLPIGEKQPKRASFFSLNGHNEGREDEGGHQGGQMCQFEKPRKRISFNLPNWEEEQQQQKGTGMMQSLNPLGIVQQLRRWSMKDSEEGRTSKETDGGGGATNAVVLRNGQDELTNLNASHSKGNQRHAFARIWDRWNREQQLESRETTDQIDGIRRDFVG
uniref:G-protein coupled receptors family 1 profile domain-containing protein n=1 Tax=Globodera rostochiensis TaxID=31243 RepID=A0A914HTK5_GLORO